MPTVPTKRAASPANSANMDETISFTSRKPTWGYLKLELITTPFSASATLDPVTTRTYLSAALSLYLGIHGLAIPIDILKTTPGQRNQQQPNKRENPTAWIRVPANEVAPVAAAISSWVGRDRDVGVGLWIRERGAWLGSLIAGNGAELFAS